MKLTLLIISTLCTAGVLRAAAQTQTDVFAAKAEVIFHEPERFTDIREDATGMSDAKSRHLVAIREHIEKQVARLLPAGSRVSIAITDIDLAGDFEPARGPDYSHIRIVKEVYPPRIVFGYRLFNARGEVVHEGRAELGDMNFMSTLPMQTQEPLRYEKEMIDTWLRSVAAQAKVAS